jgi:pimeloyl-ACP methyl ester carboxylesterase
MTSRALVETCLRESFSGCCRAGFLPLALRGFLAGLVLWLAGGMDARAEGRFQAVEIAGKRLEGNPLGDPVRRRVAVYTPAAPGHGTPLRTVYYLPGYGSSSEDFLGGTGRSFLRAIDELAGEGIPCRLVIVDCRNRWGGSQYLNSPAQGNYADYVLDEIIPEMEKRLGAPASPRDRVVAGHSSGGFGALRLALMRREAFGAVVALSPDSDFEVTHRGIVERGARYVSERQLAGYKAPADRFIRPQNGLVEMVLGLSAAYAPKGPQAPGDFEWPYDGAGRWRPEVWQRWLDADPVGILRKNPRAFSPDHRVYLDGAEHDEFQAQKGARVLRDLIAPPTQVEFLETPGAHSDHMAARFARGMEWVAGKKPRNLP